MFAASTSEMIQRASKLRERSDYEDFYQASKEDVEMMLGLVKQFIETVEKFLSEMINENGSESNTI